MMNSMRQTSCSKNLTWWKKWTTLEPVLAVAVVCLLLISVGFAIAFGTVASNNICVTSECIRTGHELTHGFDDRGSQYDMHGNLVDWWATETKKKYLKKAECIVSQYRNYTDSEVNLKLNGVNTQGENIADNGGLKEAYLAYNEWVRQHGVKPRLPGLNYNGQQMFWLSAAQSECRNSLLGVLKSNIITGFHSSAEFRVIGSVSNMPEFAQDFNCLIGSSTNPVKKCVVW